MPVFDFSNTMSEKKEEGACTYTVRYSGGDAATVERPILLLDHKSRQWKHHSAVGRKSGGRICDIQNPGTCRGSRDETFRQRRISSVYD